MNPFMYPQSAFAMFGRQQPQIPQQAGMDPQTMMLLMQQEQQQQEQQAMPQLPRQAAQYDPNEPMRAPFGLKMTRGQADYMKDLGAGIGQAFDNPVVQALSYANQRKDQRRGYDAEAEQKRFENELKLRELSNEEKKANSPKWQLGAMYDDSGREQKIFYDERDPSNFRIHGGTKKPEVGALYKIVGKDGQVVYESAENAQGATPYEKPDDFGFSVQSPDGTVISYGKGGSPIQKPTANDLEKKIVQGGEMMGRLRDMNSRFNEQYLTYQGQADNWFNNMKEKAGIDLGPDEQQKVAEYSAFQRDVTNNLSLYLNQLSGAAISPAEAERIGKTLPAMEDGPTKFRSKMGATIRDLSKAQARAKWALQNGVGQNPWEADAKFNESVQQRGDELAQRIRQRSPKATDEEIKRAVANQLKMEFGF